MKSEIAPAVVGAYIKGRLDALDLTSAAVAQMTGMDPSLLSRKLNGVQTLNFKDAFEFGLAAGRAKSRLMTRKTNQTKKRTAPKGGRERLNECPPHHTRPTSRL